MKGGAILSVGSRDFTHTNMLWRQNCSRNIAVGFLAVFHSYNFAEWVYSMAQKYIPSNGITLSLFIRSCSARTEASRLEHSWNPTWKTLQSPVRTSRHGYDTNSYLLEATIE